MFQTIHYEVEANVAKITFNRPTVLNAFNVQMIDDFLNCLKQLHHTSSVDIVVIEGEGQAFSAGGDIKTMLEGEFDVSRAMQMLSEIAILLYTLEAITIAKIHGAVAGLGLSIALGCDVLIAASSAKIAMNFIGIGLIPDGGGHFFVKERLDVVKAKQLIGKGEVCSADDALKIGLLDEIVSENELNVYVQYYVEHLLRQPIKAMIETKKILHHTKLTELQQIVQFEANSQLKLRQTKDHREGVQAFVQKRKAKFIGE